MKWKNRRGEGNKEVKRVIKEKREERGRVMIYREWEKRSGRRGRMMVHDWR